MEIKEAVAAVNAATEAVKTATAETKGASEQFETKMAGLKADFESKISALESKADKAVEAAEAVEGKIATRFATPNHLKTFSQELGEKLTEKKALLTTLKNDKKGFSIDLETKAAGIMGSGTNLTGSLFVAPQQVPGVNARMYESVHMRNLLPVGTTNSNAVRFVQDQGGEGGPAMVAEGGLKPLMDRDLEVKDAPVRKIATHFRVPEEMVEDIPYLTSFLGQIGVEEVMSVEDTQIIYGDGTGQNLTGLRTAGTAFAAGTVTVQAPNEYDVLRAARLQLRRAKFGGQLIGMVSPEDYFRLTSRKDTTNNYILQGQNGVDVFVSGVTGLQIVEHTSIVEGDFLVFTPRAAAIFDRAGTTVRAYDQDRDNAVLNLITIVIEKRLALPIYYPGGIVKGTFQAAITDLGA